MPPGPKPWTTKEQLAFLCNRKSGFATHSKTKTLGAFYTTTFAEFFMQWKNQKMENDCCTHTLQENPKYWVAPCQNFESHEKWVKNRQAVCLYLTRCSAIDE